MLYFFLFSKIHATLDNTCSRSPFPLRSSTLALTIPAPGAIPAYCPFESNPLPQQMPATCVPCPLSS